MPLSVGRTPFAARSRTLRRYCLERDTLLFSLKTALGIGTILGVINHGPAILSGQWTMAQLVPFLLTYLVPFTVAMYGQIQGKRQRDRASTKQSAQAEQLNLVYLGERQGRRPPS
jgi:hypothetical protein